MKNYLRFLIPAAIVVIFITACRKDDPQTPAITTIEGTWVGTGQYGTTPGDPTYVFKLTFKSNGDVDITGDNNSGIDTASGNWELVQDSVNATYTYSSGTALYKLSGKYSSNSNVMTGTIGLGASTTGIGLFSVTKQ